MSSETVQTATTEPAQPAQTPVEKKSGASNTSQSDFVKSLAAKQAPAFAKAVAEVKQEAKAAEAPKTEEAQAPAAEVTEETKTEAQAEPAEATEETEEVLSPEKSNLDPKLQEKINRRIGKEVAKTKKELAARVAAEAERDQLKAQLAARQEPEEKEVAVPVKAEIPLAHITSIQALNDYSEALNNDIIEAEGLLYSDFPAEGLQTKWGVMTKPQLIAALTQAKKEARTAIPAREKFLNQRTQSSQSAHEKFPFLKDPTHPGYQMAKQALRDNPVLRAYPNSDYLVGLIVKGQLADQAEAEAKAEPVKAAPAKPKPKPTPGQSEIASDASITRAPTGMMNQNALNEEIRKITGGKKSLGHKDFAAVLMAKQRFRNSQ